MPGTVLVTGDRGYIGSVLVEELLARGFAVRGLDAGYYAECLLGDVSATYPAVTADVRDATLDLLKGTDAVIHLAALSNDPLGEFSPSLTEDINLTATLRLAELAREAGVARFVYASSQSMYGVSNSDQELEEDTSEKNPITAYARTKWEAELALKKLTTSGFTVVCFRPSTVFGASPRLRCDIVFNNFVACAYTTGRIEIKSDGSPWRPVVHVRDVCSAFIAGIEAPRELVASRSYNVGIPNGNFTVRDLASAAGRGVPGSVVEYTGEHGRDSRTYRVSFARILSELGQWYRPSWTLDRGASELVEFFRRTGFTEEHFRGRTTNRLAQLKHLVESRRLDGKLRWND